MCQSQDDQIHRGNELLQAVRENKRELPGVAPFCEALEKVYEQAVSSKNRREALMVASQEATRHLNQDLVAAQDAAIALRSFIKSVLGCRNPKLGHYGIKPIRKRPERQVAAARR
jgi:hypothetical protein